jgi:hypothetical protein
MDYRGHEYRVDSIWDFMINRAHEVNQTDNETTMNVLKRCPLLLMMKSMTSPSYEYYANTGQR